MFPLGSLFGYKHWDLTSIIEKLQMIRSILPDKKEEGRVRSDAAAMHSAEAITVLG